MRILPISLFVLAACASPAPKPRATHMASPPRTWTARDLEAPRGPAILPADSAAPRRPANGGYPATDARRVFASGIALPPESYRSAGETGRTLRITEIAASRILAVIPVLDAIPLRTAVWPTAARVLEHDSLGALVATDPVSLASLRSEVGCAGSWPPEVPVRLEAYVARQTGAIVVMPRIAVSRTAGVTADPVCQVGVVGQDRVATFGIDVASALRQAARRGMAVPIRPRP